MDFDEFLTMMAGLAASTGGGGEDDGAGAGDSAPALRRPRR